MLQPQEMPEPAPGEHDLLLEVHACGLNPIDFKVRRGALAKGRPMPIILGFDVSGVVRAMGKAVTGFDIGDEVYAAPALVRNGSNAEFVSVDARTAALKPKSLNHIHAAALPLVTITAWEALLERARAQRGETVLIHAGGGGVGHVAIQLAKLHGCRVLTTASRDKSLELCQQHGADVVINYREADFVERVKQETGGRGCAGVHADKLRVRAIPHQSRRGENFVSNAEATRGLSHSAHHAAHVEAEDDRQGPSFGECAAPDFEIDRV